MDRRRFLALAGAAAAVPLVGGAGGRTAAGMAATRNRNRDAYVLRFGYRDTPLAGYPTHLRGYARGRGVPTLPGPVLSTAPGRTLEVLLRNELPRGVMPPHVVPPGLDPHNNPHAFDTTNLHVHGLQTIPHLFRPIGSDDPDAHLIGVEPGQSFRYRFPIPDDHPAGFYFYHPHVHGSTASQVMSGAAGGIVVRGDLDRVPEIAAAREVLLVVNSIYLHGLADRPGTYGFEPVPFMPPTHGGFTPAGFHVLTVNGRGVLAVSPPAPAAAARRALAADRDAWEAFCRLQPAAATDVGPTAEAPAVQLPPPVLRMQPGEVVRVRILNGGAIDYLPIVATDGDAFWIAHDGVAFAEPERLGRTLPQALGLAPANRSEILLRAPDRAGSFTIQALANTEGMVPFGGCDLLQVVVSGRRKPMRIPERLPRPVREYPLIRPAEVVQRREFTFDVTKPFPSLILGTGFTLDGESYEDGRILARPRIGTSEEWTFENTSTMGHPVHVHVNCMQVVDKPAMQALLCDVIWVPAGQSRTIRMRFKQWTGKTVMHCHILPHEDQGMMTNIIIRK